MGLTWGGFAVLIILFMMLFMRQVGPVGIFFAAVLGASIPIAAQIASGAAKIGSGIAPFLNAIGGGGFG
jgi:hypothetical protein